jgi:hypothetical protein
MVLRLMRTFVKIGTRYAVLLIVLGLSDGFVPRERREKHLHGGAHHGIKRGGGSKVYTA